MIDMIAPAGLQALWTTILLTLILGGAAAAATGRAIALTWRRPLVLVLYCFLLACVFGFLDYALFENPVIPATRIGKDLAQLAVAPGAALADLALSLGGLGLTFVWLLAVAVISFRLTRARQALRQYGFALERKGLFSIGPRAADGP